MFLFFILILVILAVSLASVMPSLLRRKTKPGLYDNTDRDTQNISIAADRLKELEAARLDSSQNQAEIEQEIESTLLDEISPPEANKGITGHVLSLKWIIPILILIPVSALGLYSWLGSPAMIAMPVASAQNVSGAEQPDIQKMIAQLEQKIASDPDNPEGWGLAANSYMVLREYSKAENAYRNLARLIGETPDLLAAWADATILSNNNTYVPEAEAMLRKALDKDANHLNALWLAGLGAQSKGQHTEAISFMERLLPLVSEDVNAQEQVKKIIANSIIEVGGPNETDRANSTANTTAATNTTPAQSDVVDSAAVPVAKLTISVEIDQSLAENIQPTDTLFVLAKAVDGPPMPLAVARLPASSLPISVDLDDSMAMMPAFKLSGFSDVRVSARISKTGNAIRESGDFISEEVVVKTDRKTPISISIANIVE